MLTSPKDILEIGPNCYERFIKKDILATMTNLDITLAGCSNLAGNYHVARSSPLEHTLFYTLKGQGKVSTTDEEYSLIANTLAILPCKQSFEIEIVNEKWDIIWLNLANTQRWRHIADNPTRVINDQKLDPLHHAMELLYSEPNTRLREGVIPIIHHYLNTALQDNCGNQSNARLTMLFQNIEKRLQFDWTIEAMCKQVHYSPPHFHRLCLQQFGQSPIQKLIQLRIDRAKSLLTNTQWPIQHIASYVGYNNIFVFSKSFKKLVGLSPSQFRHSSPSLSL